MTEAVVGLENIEYSYGFGVYETIRVSKGHVYFLLEHCERLANSARVIGLLHEFTTEFIEKSVLKLIEKNEVETCNIKILLIGAPYPNTASLEIICLNAYFPDRKIYKTGAKLISFSYERPYPHAKSLNMLMSYIAYREAVTNGAYDALLINKLDCITEGSRTNFFGLKNTSLISPPSDQILLGITRDKVIKTAKQMGYEITEANIKRSDIKKFDCLFLTSTSAKVLPISAIDNEPAGAASEALINLMAGFNKFLDSQE